MEDVGELHVTVGCMRGGKSTYALHILDTLVYDKCLYLNSTLDVRSDKPFSTHSKIMNLDCEKKYDPDFLGDVYVSDNLTLVKVERLMELPTNFIKKFDVICVDEAQFFSLLEEHTTKWVDDLNKKVFVTALSSDFKRRLFGETHRLIPHCDTFKTIREGYCGECIKSGRKTKAIFNHRMVDTVGGEQIQIGDAYLSVCRKCYNRLNAGDRARIC